jgi:hypothetical protein
MVSDDIEEQLALDKLIGIKYDYGRSCLVLNHLYPFHKTYMFGPKCVSACDDIIHAFRMTCDDTLSNSESPIVTKSWLSFKGIQQAAQYKVETSGAESITIWGKAESDLSAVRDFLVNSDYLPTLEQAIENRNHNAQRRGEKIVERELAIGNKVGGIERKDKWTGVITGFTEINMVLVQMEDGEIRKKKPTALKNK